MNQRINHHRVLTIAGSDSGGGAGIQADLKTFSSLGCFGMSVITALTAQNTVGVRAIHTVSCDFIAAQLDAVFEDIGVDAVKIGMLHSPEVIQTVAKGLKKFQVKNIVLDPVMIAKSGDRLLQEESIDALKRELLPLATLVTPNLPEASVLLGRPIEMKEHMEEASFDLLKMGPKAVLMKGGHLTTAESSDFLFTPDEKDHQKTWYYQARIETPNTHGTGCTFSSAIASHLAKGLSVHASVTSAKKYLSAALETGAKYKIGNGHGPVHHFYQWW